MSNNIKVVVRCRPLNAREVARGAKCLIRMEGGTHTFLDPPDEDDAATKNKKATERKTMSFAFDHSYWSAGPKDEPGYATQQMLFEDLGVSLLDSGFRGFNGTIFAYGQTGSGKTFTSMGYGPEKGLIPLTCAALFERIASEKAKDPLVQFTVEVTFMEIYNEKVRDLLNPKNKGNLRVREHPSLGPYVEDLSKLAVQSYADIELLMDEGNKARTVAATNMNETSSRSHSIFTLFLTQRRKDLDTNMEGEKVSRISMVDLAGSERANSTGATGARLKEGAQINKSLTTLGKVISALAAAGEGKKSAKKKDEHVPYRDSVLTWLLKDSIGGNAVTTMCAAISPADYEETLSTLRYADQAKKIKNKAVVNEDPNAKLIRELKEELVLLRARMSGGAGEAVYDPSIPPDKQLVQYRNSRGEIKTVTKAALQEQLDQSEKLMKEVAQTWEEKLERTQMVHHEREQALEELGITIEKNHVGVHAPKKMPHLVNLNEDPLMSECLVYQIKPGKTVVGNVDTAEHCDIRLSGSNILDQHCHFEAELETGLVGLYAHPGASTMVNGKRLTPETPQKLKSGDRVILGNFHIFRFNHPEEARKHREKVRLSMVDSPLRSPAMSEGNSHTGSPVVRPDSPTASSNENHDWNFARREAVVARLNGADVNLDELDDAEIERLFDGVSRLRMHRRSGTSLSGRESRMSFMDSVDGEDVDSGGQLNGTFRSTSTADDTEDTSLADSGITYQGVSETELETRLQKVKADMELQMDSQKSGYEEKIRALAATSDDPDADRGREAVDLQLRDLEAKMRRDLSKQKQRYERRIKKLKGAHSSDSGLDLDCDDETLTDEQRRLARWTVGRWRSYNRVKLAELLLSSAVVLKEANIISRELDKKVTYQFVIVDRWPLSAPTSAVEATKCLSDFDDDADPEVARTLVDTVGVKVIDTRHRALYVWSLGKMKQRLQQMRNLYSLLDKSEVSQHFSLEDPFFDKPVPSFAFFGATLVSLAPLFRNHSFCATMPIVSRCFGDAVASCRVRLLPISIAPATRPNGAGILLNAVPRSGSVSPFAEPSALVDGYEYKFEILVDEVVGLTSRDVSSVHCQVRRSAFGGLASGGEEVVASPVVEMPCDANEIRLRAAFTVVINPALRAHLASGYAPIEFFATPMPAFLDRMERWDEKKGRPKGPVQASDEGRDTPARANGAALMRQPETDFVTDQYHDISASMQMLELAANGQYQPTAILSNSPLDPGRQLPWTQIISAEFGNVRLLDQQGRVHGSTSTKVVALKPLKRPVATFDADGTSLIYFVAPWDTGAHDCDLLNRDTRADQRILVQLSFAVEIERCRKPAVFTVDVGFTMNHRDAKVPSKMFAFLRSSRQPTKATALFSIRVTPQETAKASDVWRADTSKRQLRGEDILGGWKPRDAGLVAEHASMVKREKRRADVEAVRAFIVASGAISGFASPRSHVLETDSFGVGRSLELWQRKFGAKEEVSLAPRTPSRAGSSAPSTPRRPKLTAQASLVSRNVTAARRGGLHVLRDPTSNQWVKRWFVLRRPYLYLYQFSDELEELGIINISNVHVDANPEMEQMLGRRFVFAVYSATNSHFFQASNQKEVVSWCTSIDPSFARQQQ